MSRRPINEALSERATDVSQDSSSVAGSSLSVDSSLENSPDSSPANPDSSPANLVDRSVEARTRILDAALKIFSEDGLAGARTERIAAAAGVNKALLYYYFESKEKLYIAALESVAARVRDSSLAAMRRDASPGERVLRTALNHFDRVLTQREFQSLMQQEMIRLHKGEEGALGVLVKRVFEPLMTAFEATVKEGIESGELIDADILQYPLAALGANVFYFLSGPVWGMLLKFDPFTVESLRARRVALVEFLGKAIFVDRRLGVKLALRVLADTPMPEPVTFKAVPK